MPRRRLTRDRRGEPTGRVRPLPSPPSRRVPAVTAPQRRPGHEPTSTAGPGHRANALFRGILLRRPLQQAQDGRATGRRMRGPSRRPVCACPRVAHSSPEERAPSLVQIGNAGCPSSARQSITTRPNDHGHQRAGSPAPSWSTAGTSPAPVVARRRSKVLPVCCRCPDCAGLPMRGSGYRVRQIHPNQCGAAVCGSRGFEVRQRCVGRSA